MTSASHERLDPLFIGPPTRRLFACHHAPSNGAAVAGTVIAPAVGHEYQRGHRALRCLAEALAASGQRALRFDFAGVGDSSLDRWPEQLDPWLADLDVARKELELRARLSRVGCVGLRVGAIAALRCGAKRSWGGPLVLWDPPWSGGGLRAQLESAQADFLASLHATPPARADADTLECVGFAWPRGLIADLEAPTPHGAPAPRVLLIEATPSDRGEAWLETLRASGCSAARHAPRGGRVWAEDVDKGLVPAEDIARIVQFLTEAP